jgi:phosphatidate phosphatase APP1
MKKIIGLMTLLISLSSYGSISVISDLDDTIKITNSGDTVDGATNAALKSDVFSGMTEFFMGTKYYANELYVLSASPTILRLKIETTLKKRQIDFHQLILKNPTYQQSKFSYKVQEIKKIIEQTSDDFIFLGDDVGQDPEAYAEIKRLYPNRVLAIYIHVIKNREIPTGTKYWTTLDLFLREFMAGRMTPGWIEKGLQVLSNEKDMEKIMPRFAHCPSSRSVWSWQAASDYAVEAQAFSLKIAFYCQARDSSILAVH